MSLFSQVWTILWKDIRCELRSKQMWVGMGLFALLVAFLDAPQRPLTREHLLNATRVHEDVFDRSIDIQILRLRRKLEAEPDAPRIIQTQRGVGYVFMLPVERLSPALSTAQIARAFASPSSPPAKLLAS